MIKGSLTEQYKQPTSDFLELRITTWLWFHLQRRGAKFLSHSFMTPMMQPEMENFARWQGIDLGPLLQDAAGRWLLPVERFEWVTGEKRQTLWLLTYINQVLIAAIWAPPQRLFGRNLVIACFDIWEKELHIKAAAVDQMKLHWEQQKQTDRIFKWFREKEETSRCELAWDWLVKNEANAVQNYPPISSYEDLLIFFDAQKIGITEKKFFVSAIKKLVGQQQYRKTMVGKKQCNLVLSNKTLLDLDKLAAKYGVKRSLVIEALVQFETERNLYLPEKVRSISWNENPSTS